MYRRLGGMGVLYAGAWLANYLHFQILEHGIGDSESETFWDVTSLACVVAGLAVYLLCRSRRVSPRYFADVASAFQMLGALGIYVGSSNWLNTGEIYLLRVGEVLGITADQIFTRLVVPIDEVGLRLLYLDGVTWVAVWLLVYPLIVPMPMRRTLITTLLTAAVVPVVLGVSALVQVFPKCCPCGRGTMPPRQQ